MENVRPSMVVVYAQISTVYLGFVSLSNSSQLDWSSKYFRLPLPAWPTARNYGNSSLDYGISSEIFRKCAVSLAKSNVQYPVGDFHMYDSCCTSSSAMWQSVFAWLVADCATDYASRNTRNISPSGTSTCTMLIHSQILANLFYPLHCYKENLEGYYFCCMFMPPWHWGGWARYVTNLYHPFYTAVSLKL